MDEVNEQSGTPNSLQLFRFAAFVSYSSQDSRITKRIHNAIEQYRIPVTVGKFDVAGRFNRVAPVFRDREELSSGPISTHVEAALQSSYAMIVVCSKNTPKSAWVERELRYFHRLGRGEKIFAIIIDGEPNSRTSEDECLPKLLRPFEGGTEVLAGDIRKTRDGFRSAYLKVVAGIIGVDLGVLLDRDRRRRIRRRWLLCSITIVAILLMAFRVTTNTQRALQFAMVSEAQNRQEQSPLESISFAIAGLGSGAQLFSVDETREAEQIVLGDGFGNRLLMRSPPGFESQNLFLTKDGNRLLLEGADNSVTLWNARTGQFISDLGDVAIGKVVGEPPDAPSWLVSGSSERVIVVTLNNQAKLWSLADGHLVANLGGLNQSRFLSIDKKGDLAVTMGVGGYCTFWNGQTGAKIVRLPSCVAVSVTDNPIIATILTKTHACSIYSETGNLLLNIATPVDHCFVNPQGDYAFVSRNEIGFLYSMKSKLRTSTLGTGNYLLDWEFTPDGRRIIIRDSTSLLQIYNVENGRLVATLGYVDSDKYATFSDGHFLSTWKSDYSGILYNELTGDIVERFPKGAFSEYAESDDGHWLATGSGTNPYLLNLDKHISIELPPAGEIAGFEFSPNSTRLVVSSVDQPGYIWNLTNSKKIVSFDRSGEDASNGSMFSGDGHFYMATDANNGAELWNATTGNHVSTLARNGGGYDEYISSDAAVGAVETSQGSVAVWGTQGAITASGTVGFKTLICSRNYPSIHRFGADLRSDDSSFGRYLVGRPWDPCDWRGLNSLEGWLQLERLWGVRLGLRRDYRCEDIDATGHTSKESIADCKGAFLISAYGDD